MSTFHLTILYKSSSNYERLCHNSLNETVFNSAKVEYEDALKKSGYDLNPRYTAKTTGKSSKNR